MDSVIDLEKNIILFDLIKLAIWKQYASITVSEEVFEELSRHAIASLMTPVLPTLQMSIELRNKWKSVSLQQIAYYCNYIHTQSNLPITVPYVILKGTSAAQYYEHPEFRAFGDIDIMPAREDFQTVCNMLLQNGYSENNAQHLDEIGRHRSFSRNGILIEVHAFFALFNDKDKARYLDDLIVSHIDSSHVLPDLINGLVLLEHINQHMEIGIGLRQIIDWMMFVDKCLPDEKWEEFKLLANNSGLETLATVVTKMCEKYLGLSSRNWCNNADEELCKELMYYVLESGNFGNKQRNENHTGALILSFARSPIAAFSLLQRRGLINWKSINNHSWLRHFAWLYQLIRYIKNGIGRENSVKRIKTEYELSKTRDRLFSAIGVNQTSKGLVILEDGEYVKTHKIP